MQSNVDRTKQGVPWVEKETIKLGQPFELKWYRYSELPFNKIKT